MQRSILSRLREGTAAPRIGAARVGQLEARKANSALPCSCTTVTSSIPMDVSRWRHFKCLISDAALWEWPAHNGVILSSTFPFTVGVRVYNGTHMPCWFIFPFSHIFLLCFRMSFSSFLSSHYLSWSPVTSLLLWGKRVGCNIPPLYTSALSTASYTNLTPPRGFSFVAVTLQQ